MELMDESKVLKEIRELRKELGLSQDEMASKLGMKQASYNKIELGKNALSRTHLKKISEALHTTPELIIEKAYKQLPGSLGGYANDISPSEYIRISKALVEAQSQTIKLMTEKSELESVVKKIKLIFGDEFLRKIDSLTRHDVQYLKETLSGDFDPELGVGPSQQTIQKTQQSDPADNPSLSKKRK